MVQFAGGAEDGVCLGAVPVHADEIVGGNLLVALLFSVVLLADYNVGGVHASLFTQDSINIKFELIVVLL